MYDNNWVGSKLGLLVINKIPIQKNNMEIASLTIVAIKKELATEIVHR